MFSHDVVCSGMVATPAAVTDAPVYDGGHKLENGWYLAFSGFPAEYDRVLCLTLAVEVGLLELPGKLFNTIMQFGPKPALVRGIFHSFAAMTLWSQKSYWSSGNSPISL